MAYLAKRGTDLLQAKRIASVSLPHPTRVAINGVDAAGKTTLADALVAPLEELGRPVIRASVDGSGLVRSVTGAALTPLRASTTTHSTMTRCETSFWSS